MNQPAPLSPLATADVFARAIIAAAGAYGESPISACTGQKRQARKVLTAAASGMARALDVEVSPIARILLIGRSTVFSARHKLSGKFAAAELAAERAVRYARWQPEAAASAIAEPDPVLERGQVLEFDQVQPPADLGALLQQLAEDVEREDPRPLARGGVVAAGGFGLVGESGPTDAVQARQAERLALRCPVCRLAHGQHRPDCANRPAAAAAKANTVRVAAARPEPTSTESQPIDELLLEALVDGEARNSMSLASAIGRKEMAVSGALMRLGSLGAVISETCADGPRRLVWRLAPDVAEAAE